MLRRLNGFWLLAAVVLALVFFYKLAFTDMILGRGDTFAYFYPYWNARNTALAAGHLPLWSPDIFMGVPLLANPQLGTFYPPNWLTVPFNPPDAIRISILMHVVWAIWGVYLLARHTLKLDRLPALLAGLIFGVGGYVGAHVEQINQLQGLAWMPWLFLIFHHALERPVRFIPLLAIALTLQVFTGHTQTVFITLVGLGIYGLVIFRPDATALSRMVFWRGHILRLVLILGLAGVIALLLGIPQIIPTAELMSLSNRSGGLNPNEATAFSFSPLVMGRGLLPSYDGQLFGEYVAYIGVIGLGLAIVGVLNGGERGGHLRWLMIALVGLTFALGLYNPLYWVLASLPGFNFFRVPARWLALFGLGGAMLAGLGLQSLLTASRRVPNRVLVAVLIITGLLIGASLLMTRAPADDIIGPALPTARTFIGWALALAVLIGFLIVPRRTNHSRASIYGLFGAVVIELFLASQILPFNDLVPPDVYNSQRFTASQMRAYASEQTPPGRFLSISGLLFDPGDKSTLEARYRRMGMDDVSIRHALVATKKQEMLFPNLPLQWNVPSIDGFDGGLLPTVYYTQFMSLLLPEGSQRTVDGRLGEILAQDGCNGACLPDQRWLSLTDTQYLITDKVYDLVYDGIFYDTTVVNSTRTGAYGRSIDYWIEGNFEANAVDVLYEGSVSPVISMSYGESFPEDFITAGDVVSLGNLNIQRFDFNQPVATSIIEVSSAEIYNPITIYAVVLVDTRTGDFMQASSGGWTRILSSDIEVYESNQYRRRAFVMQDFVYKPDTWAGTETALNMMRDENFFPYKKAIIHSADHSLESAGQILSRHEANIVSYSAEKVEVEVSTTLDAYLILTDAYYPGWTATMNGEPADIYRADIMFRAVQVPVGESTVIFEYKPFWLHWILIVGALAWLIIIGVTVWVWRRNNR